MRGWLLVIVALAACGRVGFPSRGDSAVLGDASDASGDGACVWSAFSTPAALPGPIQSPVDDWCPAPTLGATQLFFHSYRAGAKAALFVGTRASTADAFGAATNVTELTTGTSQQFNPTITGDGLDLVFADDRTGGSFRLYEAVRATPTGMFGTPVVLTSVNSSSTDWNCFVSDDGLRLMFTSNRTGFDQIYEATRGARTMAWSAPVVHGELTVAGTSQWTPTLSADWLDIYFSSNRAGGPGGYDIYHAHRPSLGQPFGAAALVPELSSPNDDVCPRLAVDGSTIYFAYAANTGGGNADLDAATRSCM